MKKLSAFLALILGVLPVSAMADSTEAGQKATLSGNNAFTGSVTATNLNPVFLAAPNLGPLSFNSAYVNQPFTYMLQTNQSFLAASVNPGPGIVALVQITGFAMECTPYNPALIGIMNYPYIAENTGVGGGTITFTEYKVVGAPVVIGTLVMPASPHSGPYRNIVDHKLAAPYTLTSQSQVSATVTALSGPVDVQYSGCSMTALTQ